MITFLQLTSPVCMQCGSHGNNTGYYHYQPHGAVRRMAIKRHQFAVSYNLLSSFSNIVTPVNTNCWIVFAMSEATNNREIMANRRKGFPCQCIYAMLLKADCKIFFPPPVRYFKTMLKRHRP